MARRPESQAVQNDNANHNSDLEVPKSSWALGWTSFNWKVVVSLVLAPPHLRMQTGFARSPESLRGGRAFLCAAETRFLAATGWGGGGPLYE